MTTHNYLGDGLVPMYVSGEPFIGEKTYEVKDPHNPTVVMHTVSCVSEMDVDKVIATAEEALKSWKKTDVVYRRRIFQKAAALLAERIGDYAAISLAETSTSVGFAGFDIHLAAESLEETASAATVALRGEIATTEGGQRAYIERVPYGIVFGSAPWNAPVVLGQRAVMQPIMGGNVAILKTSECSPKTQMMIAQVFAEAGLPPGVLSIIHVDPKDAPAVTEKIIAHPSVGKVNFTGSTRVGKIIAALCGKYLKPVTLELGGKAPFIVCADANLEHAANAIMFSSFFRSGEICMAANTVIAHESIYDSLLALLQASASGLSASGNPEDKAALRGLFSDASAERVHGIVKDAIVKGATIGAGSWKDGEKGNVVQPLMLLGVTPAMRIYKEELFSPVFSLLSYTAEEQAIEIANDHEYGLASAVWTRDTDAGYRIAKEINAGMVHINGATVHDHAGVPHGGAKSSGFGRFNGIEGIREFTQTKVITINSSHGQYPL